MHTHIHTYVCVCPYLCISLLLSPQTEPGLSDIAAEAERLQPKGISLATTEVRTPVPFLLRHKLRDYQHIGLDWLVMMHDRKLNGILADEMGLGKTMQTIALLAHLACEKGNWGPHLIIVPTSVLLNWEFELKKWCPAFKLITYFGSTKERRQLRVGWTKPNAFHVCITSYNLAVRDHRVFKQKKWKYIVLDEAQNIKNFKSQRWQTLLNFNSQRRLLLTGTPLQNNLMELWSLMHFLMPSVFASHSDFKEWFSNPLTGMVEGSQEYNEDIVKRLHKVLRPFLLRRVKAEVEKQMPKKYEHVIMCRLSKRQRFLYEDYMSRRKTKDTLAGGNFLSVINILMQLRKVCNHPDLFEPRPTVTPFRAAGIVYTTASLVLQALQQQPLQFVDLDTYNLKMADYEMSMDAFAAFRIHNLQPTSSALLEVCLQRAVKTEGETTPANPLLEGLTMDEVVTFRETSRQCMADNMTRTNVLRCARQPVYGQDLFEAFRMDRHSKSTVDDKRRSQSSWLWCGRDACQRTFSRSKQWDTSTSWLNAAMKSVSQRMEDSEDMLNRFLMYVPNVVAPPVKCSAGCLSWRMEGDRREDVLRSELSGPSELLHPVNTRQCFLFPETRLIQYDCGKLQTLDSLLRTLKSDGHRALIFTQMARMLDVLEIFLNYHGHAYLRLDGSTPVQKRQMMMERFNRDERIFCFILSTRSGGLGVNLTGADSVIFYDSDWNPTMDAQAQDRCHRIGQTRDVHIYRLICENTVEENILKKANQKRMLGKLAIDSGAFTTEFFQQANIRDLFEPTQDQEGEMESSNIDQPIKEEPVTSEGDSQSMSEKQLGKMLAEVEDENDVKAASRAEAEQAAELAEFDEAFMETGEHSTSQVVDSEESKVLQEVSALEEQLSGIEKFALKFVEVQNADKNAEQIKLAEREIELAKKNWELSHLQSLREEEERLAEEEEFNSTVLTYDRPEAANKVYLDEETLEEMPIWYPPTPPADEQDMYVDLALEMWYDLSTPMDEHALPPIDTSMDYDVFGLSRHKGMKKSQLKIQHKKSKDRVTVPSTLFWKRSLAESLAARLKKMAIVPAKRAKTKDQLIPLLDVSQEKIDWSITEDWIVLKTVTHVHELNIHLTIVSPAQIPNFHMISDFVTTYGKSIRSTQQCRDHFIGVIHPREENKQEDTEVKKIKQKDGTYKKVKCQKSVRTRGLLSSDKGSDITGHYNRIYDTLLGISEQIQDPVFPEAPSNGGNHHPTALADLGVKLDTAVSPVVLSQQRAERIQSEKAAELTKQTQMVNFSHTPYGTTPVTPTNAGTSTVKTPYQVPPTIPNTGWTGQVIPPRTLPHSVNWKVSSGHSVSGAAAVTGTSGASSIQRGAPLGNQLALAVMTAGDTDVMRAQRKLSSDQSLPSQEGHAPIALAGWDEKKQMKKTSMATSLATQLSLNLQTSRRSP
jgi:E1A-binding protein p400